MREPITKKIDDSFENDSEGRTLTSMHKGICIYTGIYMLTFYH